MIVRGMNRMRPSNQNIPLTTDHVFLNPGLSTATLTLINCCSLGLQTDHAYILVANISVASIFMHIPHSPPFRPPIQRYRIRELQNPSNTETKKKFCDAWKELDISCRQERAAETYDVNLLDMLLTSQVQAISEIILGEIDPKKERRGRDKVVGKLAQSTEIASAVRLFKRIQRSSDARKILIPESNCRSAMDECIEKYGNLFHQRFIEDTAKFSFTTQCFHEDDSVIRRLLSLVSPERVAWYIEQFSATKSCGEDGIHAVQLKALLSTSFISHLSLLFSACIRHGQTPERWNTALLYPLHKDTSQPYTPTNTRPLSIMVMFRRIFEGLILPIFVDSTLPFNQFQAAQGGFRRGYSTLTQTASLHHSLQSGSHPLAVFLDLEMAYDKVREDRLVVALTTQGMPPVLIQLVTQLMFRTAKFALVVNGEVSISHSRNIGLPQGSPLSPVIFNKFIDSLVRDLNSTMEPTSVIPSCLFFADDGVLLCKTWTNASFLLDRCQRWAIREGMRFKIAKCGVLTSEIMHRVGHDPLTIDGIALPIVSSYRYLGFPVTCTGIDFSTHRDEMGNKCLKLVNYLRVYSDSWTVRVRLNMFKVCII